MSYPTYYYREKRSLAQKRAIYYAIRKRQLKRQEAYIKENGLEEEYKNSKYKSMTTFLMYAKGVNIY